MDLEPRGGQMRPEGSADLISDRRGRALKLLGEKLSLNEVAHRLCCKFRYVLAECLVATRRRSPQAGFLCRSSEKTRATLRVPADQEDPTQGRHRQWLPHRIVDDRGDSQDLPRAVPLQHCCPTPALGSSGLAGSSNDVPWSGTKRPSESAGS